MNKAERAAEWLRGQRIEVINVDRVVGTNTRHEWMVPSQHFVGLPTMSDAELIAYAERLGWRDETGGDKQ